MFSAFKTFLPNNAAIKLFVIGFAAIDLPGRFMMISGPSMQPTLNPESEDPGGDILWVSKIPPRQLKIGDIAIFQSPVEHDKKLVKRVVALENQWVFSRFTNKPVFVPSGHCWLEGDNYANSHDSNGMGPIPIALLHGISTVRVHPWDTISLKCEPHRNSIRLFDPENPYRHVEHEIFSLPGANKMTPQQLEAVKAQLLKAAIRCGSIS